MMNNIETKLNELGEQIDAKIDHALEAQKANLNGQLDSLKTNELKALTDNYNSLQAQVDKIETATKRNSGETVSKNWMQNLIGQIKGIEGFAETDRKSVV